MGKNRTPKRPETKRPEKTEAPQQNASKWYHNPKWTIIISIFAFLVSFFSLGVDYVQNKLIDQQNKLQRNEDQPIFIVNYEYDKVNNDSLYDTEFVCIQNVGNVAKSIEISNYTFFTINVVKTESFSDKDGDYKVGHFICNIDIPVYGYIYDNNEANLVKGDIAMHSVEDNYRKFLELADCLPAKKDSYNYNRDLSKFVIINYTDIHDEYHTLCFLNGRTTSYDDYKERKEKAYQLFDFERYINDITCEEINEFLEKGLAIHSKSNLAD